MTPGIQPINVNKNTIKKEPQPLSTTDNGGKIIHKITRNKDITKRIKVADSVKLSSIHKNFPDHLFTRFDFWF